MINVWTSKINSLPASHPIDTSLFASLMALELTARIGYSRDFGTMELGRPNRLLEILNVNFRTMARMGAIAWPFFLLKNMPSFGTIREFDDLSTSFTKRRLEVSLLDFQDFFQWRGWIGN